MPKKEVQNEDVIELYGELLLSATTIVADNEIVDDIKANKPQIAIISKIMKKHKKELFEMLAIWNGETVETYKLDRKTFIKEVTRFFNDIDVESLFTLQGQNEEENVSGSAMVNTEENGN